MTTAPASLRAALSSTASASYRVSPEADRAPTRDMSGLYLSVRTAREIAAQTDEAVNIWSADRRAVAYVTARPEVRVRAAHGATELERIALREDWGTDGDGGDEHGPSCCCLSCTWGRE